LKPYFSHTGRPSVDPELMIRMLIIGYCLGIRSERRLCEEVKLNLAYRWFCRLSIEDPVPDYSTFSKNRHDRSLCSAAPLKRKFGSPSDRSAACQGPVEATGDAAMR
jgi:transposase